MSEHEVEAVVGLTDLVQLGSRNMQNFALLRAVGAATAGTGKAVLLKRAMSATVEEWLMAAEHLYAAGCPWVVLCERGVKGFDMQTRNLLDLAAVALVRFGHRIPVWVDPSHAVGRRDLLAPLTAAAVASGASGVMVEIHPDAGVARSDAPQALGGGELRGVARAFFGAAGRAVSVAGGPQ
jgi:3-deoxy-7-phosphoheptulonate synthase